MVLSYWYDYDLYKTFHALQKQFKQNLCLSCIDKNKAFTNKAFGFVIEIWWYFSLFIRK